MIEEDMELETELGIDSIKRVEILSEVQSMLDVEAKDVDALSRTRTVGEVVEAMKNELRSSGASGVSTSIPGAATPAPTVEVSSELLAKAETVVLEVLASKTGYETDMIEEDMELETELGIDSIKRVEILSEVQSMLDIEAKNVDALSRTRTVGEVVEAMKNELKSIRDSVAPVQVVANTNVNIRSKGCEELDLTFPSLSVLGSPSKLVTQNSGKMVLVGGDAALANVLQSTGRLVVSIDNKCSEEQLKNQLASFGSAESVVYIHSGEPIENCLLVAKHVKKQLAGSRQQFLAVVRGDGMLGYSGTFPGLSSIEKYALCGLMKTIALEWPSVQARCVDLHESIPSSQAYQLIVDELGDCMKTIRETCYDQNLIRRGVTTCNLKPGVAAKNVTSEDVWLVCGGARGITPLCIRELAKRVGGGTYYLMGRSSLEEIPSWAEGVEEKDLQKAAIKYVKSKGEKPKPMALRKMVDKVLGTKEVKANMADIEQYCPGNVHYISCDITSSDSVKEALSKLPKITGYFHASGVLRDKLIENKSVEDFRMVYNTKIIGFENIWNNLDQSAVNHCILFSSLAGFHGNVGQSDYSMANEVLNKIAYMLGQSNVSAKAFDFGPWDGGMVTPALKKHFQSQGVQIIDRPGGAASVATMITDSAPSQILVGNWGLPPSKPDQGKFVIEQKLKTDQLFKDHSLQGKQVMPFTFSASFLAEKVLGLYPGYHLLSLDDVSLFKGITLDHDVVCEIELEEELKAEVGKIYVKASLKQNVNGRKLPSYKATVVLGEKPTSKVVSPSNANGSGLVQNEIYPSILFHGPKFQGIKSVKISGDRLEAQCTIPSGTPAQPLALDLIFQSALILAKKNRGIASLPSNAEQIKFYKTITSDTEDFVITMSKEGGSNSDVVWKLEYSMQDVKGTVYNEGRVSIVLNDTLKY